MVTPGEARTGRRDTPLQSAIALRREVEGKYQDRGRDVERPEKPLNHNYIQVNNTERKRSGRMTTEAH